MPIVDAVVECPVFDSFRVRQVAGLFDAPLQMRSTERFRVEVPGAEEDWRIGVIVGPSGSGKSTIAKQAFGDSLYTGGDWPADRAVIDGFGGLSIKQITRTLTAVGFSSPRSWIKPYGVLSNGEKFRCDLAKTLLSVGSALADGTSPQPKGPPPGKIPSAKADPTMPTGIVAFDEFTSVVDRTVARIGSAAASKAIRSGRLQTRFVAVTCHYDVVPWLEPDWVLDMATGELARGRLCRPPIRLDIRRVDRHLWPIFKRHHYLSNDLHRSAACYGGFVDGSPATFTAVLFFPHPTRPGWREHRTVCLPDFQGVGLGSAMSEFVAAMYRATGKPYFSTTSHPALIAHRCRSPLWRVTRKPRMKNPHANGMGCGFGRLTAGFEYVRPLPVPSAGTPGEG